MVLGETVVTLFSLFESFMKISVSEVTLLKLPGTALVASLDVLSILPPQPHLSSADHVVLVSAFNKSCGLGDERTCLTFPSEVHTCFTFGHNTIVIVSVSHQLDIPGQREPQWRNLLHQIGLYANLPGN